MAKNRLSRDLWLAAGFNALTEQGPVALKAEPLARRLGTTKGSFYWHFKDVPDFQSEMLELWEARAFADIDAARAAEDNPVKRLRAISDLAARSASEDLGGVGAEPAMRAWARENEAVAAAVARIDDKRLAYLTDLLTEVGLTNQDLSRMIYGALLGMQDLSARDGVDNTQALGTLVDLILALYEEE
ncbi:TetR/AcrR family transcriptional regulator [Cognatishimia maritima]|uniref:Transcriptional regulator, TetR family n=1 Tax=Cognatishimia maritima TaxID=870908 RepID=A0A1M5NAN2_9RHOB|nr:TetR/AcrR family transcriptional regulator [Cognatishimia maritima]SHG86522.1 transcriptional regulator, TetR family [Cognatishimia maritima]